MANLTTKPAGVVLINDIECLAAITHKYELTGFGFYRSETGHFWYALLKDANLDNALEDYLNTDYEYQVQVTGYGDHRSAWYQKWADNLDTYAQLDEEDA